MADVTASQIMYEFAERTGLTSDKRPPERYLWTDAFAVCNFLGLYVEAGDQEALALARRLVEQTHQVLGKHRPDDARSGWISGLSEKEGAQHPTLGGLRIGKELPERGAQEIADTELEWERDGQYFHYLTKWMHALGRMAEVTEEPVYHRWALELAKTAHERFSGPPSSHDTNALYWKMSIDLSRPQILSMGQHDPLDGWLTYQAIQAGRVAQGEIDLSTDIRELAQRCAKQSLETDDPLGIGGLLCDAWRLALLNSQGVVKEAGKLSELLRAAVRGLDAFVRQRPFEHVVARRLAFRELGLSIGLLATQRLQEFAAHQPSAVFDEASSREALSVLARCRFIADNIARFWLEPSQQASPGWRAHRDINEVMLATSLAPGGFLGPRPASNSTSTGHSTSTRDRESH